jgi:hypothetical protein
MTPMPSNKLGDKYRYALQLADQLKELLEGGNE